MARAGTLRLAGSKGFSSGGGAAPIDVSTVFSADTFSGNASTQAIVNGLDLSSGGMVWIKLTNGTGDHYINDTARGAGAELLFGSVAVQTTGNSKFASFDSDGFTLGSNPTYNGSGDEAVAYSFVETPGFFDIVTWTGNGTAGRAVGHDLGVEPTLVIIKTVTTSASAWAVWSVASDANSGVGTTVNALAMTSNFGAQLFNTSSGLGAGTYTPPTSTTLTLSNDALVNSNSVQYIAYLFGNAPGACDVGTYSGTGSAVNVDCGFTNGVDFVMIKRVDDAGGWYVWDTARGLVAGDDPYILIESTAAQATGTDYVDPLAAGFTVTATAPAALNASGGTYLYWAIAAPGA